MSLLKPRTVGGMIALLMVAALVMWAVAFTVAIAIGQTLAGAL